MLCRLRVCGAFMRVYVHACVCSCVCLCVLCVCVCVCVSLVARCGVKIVRQGSDVMDAEEIDQVGE